jgi:hypothetical protein
MKFSCLLIALVCFASCRERGKSPIEERLKTSDSLVLQFYSEKEVLENAVTSTDLNAIKQFINYIDSDKADSLTCAKSGLLIFYSDKKELQRVLYKIDCRQFEFTLNGKKEFTKMPDAAKHFINAIKNGER